MIKPKKLVLVDYMKKTKRKMFVNLTQSRSSIQYYVNYRMMFLPKMFVFLPKVSGSNFY